MGGEIEALDQAFEWLKVDPAPPGSEGTFAKLLKKVPVEERVTLVAEIVYMLFLG